MKVKLAISLVLTLAVVYSLNRSWNFGTPIPPLGKFLDPFHGFWANATTADLHEPASLDLPGLREPVTIIYDSTGIPHIFAKNDGDLYFAQGYVTAKDRLCQMEFQTHDAAGRISEIVGKIALSRDRETRRRGMVVVAKRSMEMLETSPEAKAMVDHYTMGVNAFISSLDYEHLPLEYKLLGYEPETWTNLKAGLLLANMSHTLSSGSKDVEMTNALKLFGKANVDLLFPDNEMSGDPIVDAPGNWKFKPITLDSIPLAVPDELFHTPSEKFNHDVGSNNWAVSGKKTASGFPILSSDPHLGLNLPSLWYLIHLNAPGINTMGGSLPGAPSIVIGFTDSVAWGMTNAQRDLVDFYRIQFKDKSKNEYLSDGKWRKSQKVIEKILIKGDDPFYDTVVYTHQGPVRYDDRFEGRPEEHYLAYHWISAEAKLEWYTFYLLNRARNYGDFMKAMDAFAAPAHNFAFASTNGDIAMRTQGKFPVRRKDEGKYVLDGTKTSQEWKAFIPNEQNIQYKNPERGFVASANQYPVDTTYPYYIQADSYEAYRNQTINKVLSGLNKIVPADMMNLQQNNFNLRASEVVPLFLSFLNEADLSPVEHEAYTKLKSWDFMNTVDSEGATYYQVWWDAFYFMLWSRMTNEDANVPLPTNFMTVKLIRMYPDLEFFDNPQTPEKENAAEIIRQSFSVGLKRVAKWKEKHPQAKSVRWADFKDTYIRHLSLQSAFSEHVEHGGGEGVINATTRSHGPSWRMVVSLEKKGVQAWGVYPGGQSGNPGSPYYTTFLSSWAKGKYFKLHFTSAPEELKPCTIATTVLKSK